MLETKFWYLLIVLTNTTGQNYLAPPVIKVIPFHQEKYACLHTEVTFKKKDRDFVWCFSSKHDDEEKRYRYMRSGEFLPD